VAGRRRIRRSARRAQSPSLFLHQPPYCTAAVAGQSIPDDQQLAGYVAQQMLEELDDLRIAPGSRRK